MMILLVRGGFRLRMPREKTVWTTAERKEEKEKRE